MGEGGGQMTCDCGGSSGRHKVWCAVRGKQRADRLAAASRPSSRKSAEARREENRAAHAAGWKRIRERTRGRSGIVGGGP